MIEIVLISVLSELVRAGFELVFENWSAVFTRATVLQVCPPKPA